MQQSLRRLCFFFFLSAGVFVLTDNAVYAQPCGPTTPSFTVNLTGDPDSTWISPTVQRDDTCCGATAPDKCVEFWVTLDPAAQGISFNIASGAIPPGALYYEIGCANPAAVGDTMCLTGVGPHRITFCKPGNNQNEYSITSIAAPSAGPPTVVSMGCMGMIYATGYDETSLSWTSVSPGPVGAYDIYLSCDTACDTVIVTAQPGYPPSVYYQVCGYPTGGCGIMLICDTVRVDFVSDLVTAIQPQNPTVCFGGPPTTIIANGSGGGAPYSYLWSTGATTSSIIVGVGTYWVQMNDTTNCSPVFDTITVTTFTANITANAGTDDSACIYNPVFTLNGSVTGVTGGIWTNGNGIFSPNDSTLNATYTATPAEVAAGTITLYLTTTGNGTCPADTDTIVLYIVQPPIAAFTSTAGVCQGLATSFTDQSTPAATITSWNWNFGDTTFSTLQNPTHTYSLAGTYTVTLIVGANTSCIDTVTQVVTVNPMPTAAFNSTAQCFVDSVYFTDASTISSGSITGWSWNFGDAGSSTLQNPAHSYTAAGTYTVTLIVISNFGCSDTITQVVTVQPSPLANFGFNNTCIGNAINFTDSSTIVFGNIISWNWNFGDATISALQNPSHTYTASGTYTVTLIVTSAIGCVDTIALSVTVYPGAVAAFTNTGACQGLSTSFTDLSTGNPTSWSWNFGDATSSTLQNPSHAYASEGTYTVTLIVTTVNGCSDTVVQTIIVNPLPTANFNSTALCFVDSVFFFDASTISSGSITGWSWSFGDAGSSTLQNPSHVYAAPGTYTVTLIVTSNFGCSDTITQVVTVQPSPLADFGFTIVCQNDPTFFTDSSSISFGNIISWNWNFGDATTSALQNPSHTYSLGGTYNVTLIVTSATGCVDTITIPVTVNALPVAAFSSSGMCVADGITFTDLSSVSPGSVTAWQWYFGDAASGNLQNPIHYYSSSGNYAVTLIVTSNNGCLDTITQAVTVNPSPTAVFTADANIVFMDQNVNFSDQSTPSGTIISWYWDFGDNTNSTLQNPSHSYSLGGTYTVMEVVTNSFGCTDTAWYTIVVTVPPDIPTGFSPNADGQNDILYVLGGPYKKLNFRIYNNWGELIFVSEDQQKGWDGTRNDVKQPLGVYVYTIYGVTEDEKEHYIKGDVTLLR